MQHTTDQRTTQEPLYRFIKSDGGRSLAKNKPKHNGDCTVRALSLATGTTYDQAADALREDGGLTSRFMGADIKRLFQSLEYRGENYHGFTFKWVPFPAVKGETRMNPVKFCQQFSEGKYIARTARHVFAVVDGVVMDSWEQDPNRCIYGAWKVEAEVSHV